MRMVSYSGFCSYLQKRRVILVDEKSCVNIYFTDINSRQERYFRALLHDISFMKNNK